MSRAYPLLIVEIVRFSSTMEASAAALARSGVSEHATLLAAAACADMACLETLLENPSVDPCANNFEVVVAAARNGHSEVLRRLLRDPRVRLPNWVDGPLAAAVKGKHVAAVEALLADPSYQPPREMLLTAVEGGDPRVLEVLLPRLPLDGRSALYLREALIHAAAAGNMPVVKALLRVPAVPWDALSSACAKAAAAGHTPVVETLLADSRTDPAGCSEAALSAAMHGAQLTVVDRLLQHPRLPPASVTAALVEAVGPLWLLSHDARIATVQRLLADPRAGPSGVPLRLAAGSGSVAVLDLLLHDARTDTRCYGSVLDDEHPLNIAAAYHGGNAHAVSRLLQEPSFVHALCDAPLADLRRLRRIEEYCAAAVPRLLDLAWRRRAHAVNARARWLARLNE